METECGYPSGGNQDLLCVERHSHAKIFENHFLQTLTIDFFKADKISLCQWRPFNRCGCATTKARLSVESAEYVLMVLSRFNFYPDHQ